MTPTAQELAVQDDDYYPTPADMATTCDGCGERLAVNGPRIEVLDGLYVVCSDACAITATRNHFQ